MATVAEFNALVGLFTEAFQKLDADKSEVVIAREALAAAQTSVVKEEGDVTDSAAALTAAWDAVKSAGDQLVNGLIAS